MRSKQVALTAVLLTGVFLAHAGARFTQIGGAQFAPSIAIYLLMAYFLATEMKPEEKVAIAFLVGVLTMIATSSPFPPANIPAHGGGFLVACILTTALLSPAKVLSLTRHMLIAFITVFTSWSCFAVFTWLGLIGTSFVSSEFERFGIDFGRGFVAWFLFGALGVAVPSLIIALIVTPILYKALRPTLVRHHVVPAKHHASPG